VTKGLKRVQDHVRQVPREIAQLKADLAAAGAPAERAKLETSVRLAESYLAEVKALKPALPTIAFEQTMKLYRRDREIHLLYLGRAHTEGDVFVYLPREKVVVTGDAVIGWTPFMGDGYPEDWTATLDRLAQLDFTTMIMGHGDVAGRNWLSTFRGYIHDMVGAVRDEAAAGATLEEVQQRVPAKLAPTYEKALFRLRPLSPVAPGHHGQYRAHVRDGGLGGRVTRQSSGAGRASTRPGLSRARSFCSVWTRRMSGTSGRIARKTTEISQKSSA